MTINRLQFIKKVLYQLKQRYGARVEYYQINSTTVDDETGRSSNTRTKIVIKKAIRLPDSRTRGFQYDLSFIAANKNFTMGGNYDRDSRDFIISRKDFPSDFEPRQEDYIVMNNERYNVKKVIELDERQGYYITGEATESEDLGLVIDQQLVDGLEIDQQTEVT